MKSGKTQTKFRSRNLTPLKTINVIRTKADILNFKFKYKKEPTESTSPKKFKKITDVGLPALRTIPSNVDSDYIDNLKNDLKWNTISQFPKVNASKHNLQHT